MIIRKELQTLPSFDHKLISYQIGHMPKNSGRSCECPEIKWTGVKGRVGHDYLGMA